MAKVYVVDRQGQEEALEIRPGTTLMQTISDAGIPDLLALCGGVCSCATCHVYVDETFAGALTPMSQDENDLLDSSEHRNATSRLSCQVRLSAEQGGLRVTIAPED